MNSNCSPIVYYIFLFVLAGFINPYGIQSMSQDNSEASSENLSQFDTARDYHDFDMQNDLFWYDEKDDSDFMTPCFEGPDFFACPSEDKFVTTSQNDKQHENSLDKKCLFYLAPLNDENEVHVVDYYHFDRNYKLGGGIQGEPEDVAAYGCSDPFCKCSAEAGGFYDGNPVDHSYLRSKETDLNDCQLKVVEDIPTDSDSAAQHNINTANYCAKGGSPNDWVGGKGNAEPHEIDSFEFGDGGKGNAEPHESHAPAEGEDVTDELLMYNTHDDEYELFDLRIIHRKNRFVGNRFIFALGCIMVNS
jgi:hypothetical protein